MPTSFPAEVVGFVGDMWKKRALRISGVQR